jgi:hypothetical protein
MNDPFADLLPPPDFSNVVGGGPNDIAFKASDPFADLTPKAPAPLMKSAMPERTGMEAVSDAATRIRQTLNSVAGGAVAAPVNLANMLMNPPHQRAINRALGVPTEDIAQPDFVRGIQESLSVDNELEGEGLSDKAKMQAEQFQKADGFTGAAKYLLDNPSYALTEGLGQLPQFLQLVPGSTIATVGAQAAGAASQNVQQIEEELRKRGVPESEIKDRAADAFAQSMIINSALPMLPGGTSFDRMLAGKAEQVAGAGATRFLKPLLGESATEGLQESADQVIQNYAQDDPLGQGVGQAAALGTLMGTATGGMAGGVDLARGDANAGMREANRLTGNLERSAERVRTPESDAVDAGREAVRAMHQAAGDTVKPDPRAFVPEKLTDLPNINEVEAAKPLDREALLRDLENEPAPAGVDAADAQRVEKTQESVQVGEPELTNGGRRVFYPGDTAAMRAKLKEAGLDEGMRKVGENGVDAGLYFPAKMKEQLDAVLRPEPQRVDDLQKTGQFAGQVTGQLDAAPETTAPAGGKPAVKRSERGIEVGEATDLTPEEMAAFERQTAPKAPERNRPKTGVVADDNVTKGLTGLAQNDDAFSLPASKKKAVGEIVRDIEPGYTAAESAEMAEGATVPAERAWRISTPDGGKAAMFQDGGNVWIDVSDLSKGQDGSRIYNIAANYAHNNGKKFIGDPSGISDVALKRRPEQMLSSALKFGTTDHIGPHAQQLKAHPEIGLSALNWKEGDFAHNIRELARVTSEATAKEFTEVADISYNPESLRFERADGSEVTDAEFKQIAAQKRLGPDAGERGPGEDGGVRPAPTAGVRTLKRAVITKQLSSPEGGKLAELLARNGGGLPESNTGKSLPGLGRTLYSKSESKQKSAPKRLSDAEVKQAKADAESRVADHWGRSAVNKLKNRGRVEFVTKQEILDRKLGDKNLRSDIDSVDGFFDPESGKAYIVADSSMNPADLPGVLSHEVFHANIKQFLGSDGYKRLEAAFRKLKNRDKDIAAAYKRVPKDTVSAHVDEEGIAYLAQEAPKHRISQRLTDEAKLFLNRLGVPLDWLNAHAAAVRKIAALNLKDAANRGGVVQFGKDGIKYQKVFHGTPHRGIEKEGFKLQKIGTGEGNQAFGFGLYFASSKDIAEHYRRALSRPDSAGLKRAEDIAEWARSNSADDAGAIQEIEAEIQRLDRNNKWSRSITRTDYDSAISLIKNGEIPNNGQLYHAEVPEDSDLLDYDKPLSEQPEKVREALASLGFSVDRAEIQSHDEALLAALSGDGKASVPRMPSDPTGQQIYAKVAKKAGGEEAAAQAFNEAGIPGLRYLDGTSRNNGKGSHNYVIWDESAISDVTPYYSKRVDDKTGFYSALTDAVEEAKGAPKSADAAAWKGWLDGAQRRGEFKQAERDWSGVDAWLDEQGGKVSREQLADFVRANEVKVDEVELGSSGENVTLEDIRAAERRRDFDESERLTAIYEDQELGNNANGSGNETKFAAYQIPGGSNYKELLLTLPPKAVAAEDVRVEQGEDGRWRAVGRTSRGGELAYPLVGYETRQEADQHAARLGKKQADASVNFKSGHFDQPNILAHVRFNERTDADGKKVLFVEEVQSDWHQAGRKRGYGKSSDFKPHTYSPEEFNISQADSQWVTTDNSGTRRVVGKGVVDGEQGAREYFARWLTKLEKERAAEIDLADSSRVPDAPFKKEWPMLAMKRVFRYAAENGFDRVAWTTGEQQAARYDLSKQIDTIEYRRKADGGGVLIADDLTGKKVMDERIDSDSQLEDYIGKEAAEKILRQDPLGNRNSEDKSYVLNNADLKVGGEGMKAFYDKMLPNEVNKWAKRFGAKVGDTRLASKQYPAYIRTLEGKRVNEGSTAAVHSLDITDSMRDAVLEGQPMFSRRTPELESAMEKAGMPMEKGALRRAAESLGEKVDAVRSYDRAQLQQQNFDRFHGIKYWEDRAGVIPDEQSPYIAARLSTGAGSVAEFVMADAGVKWKDGILQPDDDVKGLIQAIEPVRGSLPEFIGWMAGKRAQRLMKEGRENNFTQEDIDQLLKLDEGRETEFKQAAKDYAAWNKMILDVGEKAGIINPDTRAIWENPDYIPFIREQLDGPQGAGTKQTTANQVNPIKKLGGGKGKLQDPMTSIIQNAYRMIDASMKNHAMLQVVDELGHTGVLEDATLEFKQALIPMSQVKKALIDKGMTPKQVAAMPKEAFEGVQKMMSIVAPTDPNVVRIMRDGKAEYYRVLDPLLLRALTAFKDRDSGAAMSVMRAAKRLLTAGATATPGFIMRNWIRDTAHSFIIHPDKMLPGFKAMEGAARSFTKDPIFRMLAASGAGFGHGRFNAADPGAAAKQIRRALKTKGWGASSIDEFTNSLVNTPAKLWSMYQKFGAAAENANRYATADYALKKGKGAARAMFDAKDMLDFSMQGDGKLIQFLGDTVPFFNARMQGLYKLQRAGGLPGMGLRGKVAAKGFLMAMASTAYIWSIMNDPEKKELYDELEDWDKDSSWHFWGGPDEKGERMHYRIPKPFEVGFLYGTTAEHFYRALTKDEAWGKMAERMGAGIAQQLQFDPTPQAFKPLIDIYANKNSFTGREIENIGDEGKLPWDRYDDRTSPIARSIADVTGKGLTKARKALDPEAESVGLSPKQIEFLWDQYTAGVGQYALGIADSIVKRSGMEADTNLAEDAAAIAGFKALPNEPSQKLPNDIPGLGWFFKKEDGTGYTKYQSALYDTLREADKVNRSIKGLRESGDYEEADRLESENRTMLGFRKPFGSVRRKLGEFRKEMQRIRDDEDMTPDEKRKELDDIARARNELVKQVYTNYKQARQSQGEQ